MKRFILKLVMSIIIAITFISCTNVGKNMTVKGRVLNPITGEVYGGVVVEMIKGGEISFNGGNKEVRHTVTDENGEFSISAMRLAPVWIQVQANDYKLGWDYKREYYSMLKVDKGKTMHVDYHLVPYTHLKLKINNISCNTDDKFILYMKNQIASIDSTYSTLKKDAKY